MKWFNKKLYCFVILMFITALAFNTIALAASEPTMQVFISQNGSQAVYVPNGTLVIFGQVKNVDGYTIAEGTMVRLTITDKKGQVIMSSDVRANASGYYRTITTLPSDIPNGIYTINALTAGSNVTTKKFTVDPTQNKGVGLQGYYPNLEELVPASTDVISLVFSSNVNYFNNKDDYPDQVIGVNEANVDSIRLYKHGSSTPLPVGIDLISNLAEGELSLPYYNPNSETNPLYDSRKKFINIKPERALSADTSYDIEIDGTISANNGGYLGSTQVITFKTEPGISNVATLTSKTYTVSANGTTSGTITGVSPNTKKQDFINALEKGEPHQTWDVSGIKGETVVTGDTLVVTAQDGTTKVTYTIAVNTVFSNIATLTSKSNVYTVSSNGTTNETITNVPSGTSKATFRGNLIKGEPNQTWDESNISDPVVTGDTLVVTAQDGTTKVIYTISVKAAGTPTGGGGKITLPTVSSLVPAKDIGQIITDGGIAKLKLDSQKALDALKGNTGTAIAIDISSLAGTAATERAVQVPSQVIDAVQKDNKSIVLQNGDLAVVIPPAALVQGNDMTISMGQVDKQTVQTAPEQVSNTVTYEFNAQVGSEQTHNFEQALTITLPIPAGVTDPEKLGVYYLNKTSGQWEYMGGRIINGKLVFTTSHFSTYMVAESTKTFTDIASHWAKDDIEVMVARHIINGIDAGIFAPQNNITRAEFAALLSRVLKLSDVSADGSFKDVTGNEWYAGDVNKAAKAGIILGSDGNFRPGDRITRQEMAVMIQRAYSYAGGKIDTLKDLAFTDKGSISSWANNAVQSVYSLGIIKGRTDGSFGALDNATRAEGTVMLKTLMDKLGL